MCVEAHPRTGHIGSDGDDLPFGSDGDDLPSGARDRDGAGRVDAAGSEGRLLARGRPRRALDPGVVATDGHRVGAQDSGVLQPGRVGVLQVIGAVGVELVEARPGEDLLVDAVAEEFTNSVVGEPAPLEGQPLGNL